MKIINPNIVIHHSPCIDGGASAWLVTKYFNTKPVLIGIKPGVPITKEILEQCAGKYVLMLDVMYNTADMELLSSTCNLYCIDHHSSNAGVLTIVFTDHTDRYIFDESKSAAILTHEWLYPDKPIPNFITYIGERDLFRFVIPEVKPFSTGLFNEVKGADATLFEVLDRCSADESYVNQLIMNGNELQKRDDIIISHICSTARKYTLVARSATYTVMAASTYAYRSEVGNKLANMDCDFSITYHYDISTNAWWISLRGSNESQLDLAEIARDISDDGGGHKKASGFTWRQELACLLKK
jgi:oligoribonuclease NrnB/cAMP/cGMP phosphodiesterase (DHH superfamily)